MNKIKEFEAYDLKIILILFSFSSVQIYLFIRKKIKRCNKSIAYRCRELFGNICFWREIAPKISSNCFLILVYGCRFFMNHQDCLVIYFYESRIFDTLRYNPELLPQSYHWGRISGLFRYLLLIMVAIMFTLIGSLQYLILSLWSFFILFA